MIENMKQLKELLAPISELAHVRVLFKEGNKVYPFRVSSIEKFPSRDENGQLRQMCSIVVEEPYKD